MKEWTKEGKEDERVREERKEGQNEQINEREKGVKEWRMEEKGKRKG